MVRDVRFRCVTRNEPRRNLVFVDVCDLALDLTDLRDDRHFELVGSGPVSAGAG
jgi:hypothetical protein